MTRRIWVGSVAWLLVSGWIVSYGESNSAPEKADASIKWKSVLIEKVPHVEQKPDFCGEACAEMFLRKLGFGITQDDIFNVSGADPLLGRGCHTAELAAALKKVGFKVGNVWTTVAADKAGPRMSELWTALHADLTKGIPSIICMRTGEGRDATEHFRLVLGYDGDKDEVIYHEPAESKGAYVRMDRKALLRLWPLRYTTTEWTVIRLVLESVRIQDVTRDPGLSNADFAQHIRKLKEKAPPKGFTILIERPFVVIGDEAPDEVRWRADHTVRWAVTRLKSAYFRKDPGEIIDIWLFKDDDSYKKHAEKIFGDHPTTPYGYSSTEHHALIMNIATGGGTLVHEIVHPFMAANFPECPSWLNEGLGSLYEQSGGDGDQILGLTNWRLAGLQKAIKEKLVPSFKELTGTTKDEFYTRDKGTNYAQARYLCYYLQEKNLLRKYYHKFYENRLKDPTGYETLKEVLGEEDMDAFKKKWEAFVLALKFP